MFDKYLEERFFLLHPFEFMLLQTIVHYKKINLKAARKELDGLLLSHWINYSPIEGTVRSICRTLFSCS